jgi:hypothetical protein
LQGWVLSKNARNKHEELIEKIAIKKDGYIETYLVNETSENVWFDQFRILSAGLGIIIKFKKLTQHGFMYRNKLLSNAYFSL